MQIYHLKSFSLTFIDEEFFWKKQNSSSSTKRNRTNLLLECLLSFRECEFIGYNTIKITLFAVLRFHHHQLTSNRKELNFKRVNNIEMPERICSWKWIWNLNEYDCCSLSGAHENAWNSILQVSFSLIKFWHDAGIGWGK